MSRTEDGYELVRSLLIVEKFGYDLMEKAVNAILPNAEDRHRRDRKGAEGMKPQKLLTPVTIPLQFQP